MGNAERLNRPVPTPPTFHKTVHVCVAACRGRQASGRASLPFLKELHAGSPASQNMFSFGHSDTCWYTQLHRRTRAITPMSDMRHLSATGWFMEAVHCAAGPGFDSCSMHFEGFGAWDIAVLPSNDCCNPSKNIFPWTCSVKFASRCGSRQQFDGAKFKFSPGVNNPIGQTCLLIAAELGWSIWMSFSNVSSQAQISRFLFWSRG